MITKEDAIKMAKKVKPKFRIASITEKNDGYILNMVPNSYHGDPNLFANGLLRVDRKDGKVEVYNPLIALMGD